MALRHIDERGWARIRKFLSDEEFARYSNGQYRVQLITTWRPLHTVFDAPLAICDPDTLSQNDLITITRVGPEQINHISCLKHKPQHRFYYLREQRPEELLLFRTWDSENDRIRTPHGSFKERELNEAQGELPRESIDARAIVITRK